MKNPRVLDRAGDDSQITSWDWDMCCQSLGSSAGIQGPGDPTTANSWMLNGSQHPAEECWAPSQACWAEGSVDGFQGSAQRSRFCGKIQIWTCQLGKQLPLLHPALLHQLFWESIYSCPVCPQLQEGGEHGREVNTGSCLVSQGSTHCQEQSPAAWVGEILLADMLGSRGEPGCRHAVEEVWLGQGKSVLTTETPPPPRERARVPAPPSPQRGGLGVPCETGPS